MTVFGEYPKIDTPFAMGDESRIIPSVGDGFSPKQATPTYNGGTQITRHEMNGLGYLATIGSYLDRIGYPYGGEVRTLGYPKGAIITEIQGDEIREWLSLKDDNIWYGSQLEVDESAWQPIHKTKNYNFFPDYSSRTLLFSTTVTDNYNFNINIDNPGWILVQRTIPTWDQLSNDGKIFSSATVELGPRSIYDQEAISNNETIYSYEGKTATRFFPISEGNLIVRGVLDSSEVSEMSIEIFMYSFGETE